MLFGKMSKGRYIKSKVYHYKSEFKDTFYNMDWGISHSCFNDEPFGYGIFGALIMVKYQLFIQLGVKI